MTMCVTNVTKRCNISCEDKRLIQVPLSKLNHADLPLIPIKSEYSDFFNTNLEVSRFRVSKAGVFVLFRNWKKQKKLSWSEGKDKKNTQKKQHTHRHEKNTYELV